MYVNVCNSIVSCLSQYSKTYSKKGGKKKKPAIVKMYESGKYLSQMFCLALTATTGSIHDFVTQSSA